MDTVVFDESPLADYLRDGDESEVDLLPAIATPERDYSSLSDASAPSSPTPFAPTGRPSVRTRFRKHVPPSLHIVKRRPSSLELINGTYSSAIAANIDRAEKAKFLENFRYIIVASQLLSGHPGIGQPHLHLAGGDAARISTESSLPSLEGFVISILGALAIAIVLSWVTGGASASVTWRRILVLGVTLTALVLVGRVYMRRQSLRNKREQALSEISSFVSNSHEFDGATSGALGLIQEVELVSRGYRLSTPLPPVSRLEERTQSRKCSRLRKRLHELLATLLKEYSQVSALVRGHCNQTELEKYYDIYDINDLDMSDAMRNYDEADFDDAESLRTLKLLAARFNTVRKMFLCAMLALDGNGEGSGLQRWAAAVQSLQDTNEATKEACSRLHDILNEGESATTPSPIAIKTQLTPGRERWRSSLRKLNGLTTGIRGLQAKLQILREESDRALNDSDDLSELGPNMMLQYESIGADLKDLMAAWEEGRTALASGIDRNEKRLSSMSSLISPSSSLSGLTTVEESGGSADDALKALIGESPHDSYVDSLGGPDLPEVFEAVALPPRLRSTLTREERIVKVREEREQKAMARQRVDATKGMLKELEMVIHLRPGTRRSMPAARVSSL